MQASKVPACAAMAKEAVDNGLCVVIGLQSTGAAAAPPRSPTAAAGAAACCCQR